MLAAVVCACVPMLIPTKHRDAMGQEAMAPKTQVAEYNAAPKMIEELQQFRQTTSNNIRSGGGTEGTAKLVNLNPTINAWYLLKVAWQHGSESSYHLENPARRSRKLILDPKYPLGIEILEGKAQYPCNLFEGGAKLATHQPHPETYAKQTIAEMKSEKKQIVMGTEQCEVEFRVPEI